jgi:hypothetical protein
MGAAGGDAGSGDATAWLTPPSVPAALVVPAGAVLKAHYHAAGVQIYTCTASGGGTSGSPASYAWTLKAPNAVLTDVDGVQQGTHGAGPSWTSNDGSVANGTKIAGVDAPVSGAIQWLLLRVSSTSGTGVFSDVTYVQRVSTAGGVAPASGCDSTTAGMDASVGYSAEYYFYTGGV